MTRTVIIGLGNPILTDDGVGPRVARSLGSMLTSGQQVDVVEVSTGGLRLLDAMEGYDGALVVDAMVTGEHPGGRAEKLDPWDLGATRNTFSTHDMSLPAALALGRALGLSLPQEILLWGIEADDVETFGEELSEEVAEGLPVALRAIAADVARSLGLSFSSPPPAPAIAGERSA